MLSPSFCIHSTANPRDKTSIKPLLTFFKALYSSNISESKDFPEQAMIHRSPRLEPVHAPESALELPHRSPHPWGLWIDPYQVQGWKGWELWGWRLERNCWGWRAVDRAGKELIGLERSWQILVLCVSSKGSPRTCNSSPNLPQVVPISWRELVPEKAHGAGISHLMPVAVLQWNSASQIWRQCKESSKRASRYLCVAKDIFYGHFISRAALPCLPPENCLFLQSEFILKAY